MDNIIHKLIAWISTAGSMIFIDIPKWLMIFKLLIVKAQFLMFSQGIYSFIVVKVQQKLVHNIFLAQIIS